MSEPDRQTLFRELLDRSHARWAGIARAYSDASDHDDLLQEIALQVWRSLERFEGKSSIDTWAYRVALNTALAWRRGTQTRTQKLKHSTDEVARATRDLGAEGRVEEVLDRFLKSLPEGSRAVMLLHLDGVPPAEAADVLGVTEGTHRTRLHRIRKRFEEDFCQEEGAS